MIKKIYIVFILLMCLCRPACAAYERVISLSPAITEILFALEAEEHLVGVSSYCDYPPRAKEITDMGGFINPNMERILLQKPDMVILSPNSGTKMIQEALDRLKITNQVVSFYTVEQLLEAYTEVGALVGKHEEAAHLRTLLESTIAELSSKTEAETRPTILFVREHSPLYVSGEGTYEDDLIRIVGGNNSIRGEAGRYPQYTLESVIALDPDIVIDAAYYETPTAEQQKSIRSFWSRLKTINAVQNKKVFIIKTDIHSVPGPRTPKLLRLLAQIVHPEIFGEETELSLNVLEEIKRLKD